MQSVSILVADDDPNIRHCLRHAMESDSRLKVQWEADNGLQALSLTMQHHPDIILLDAQMPRMDGMEVSRCLRLRRVRARIVIMSVYEQARMAAMQAGADAFVVKDCGCAELRQTLYRVLQDHDLAALR